MSIAIDVFRLASVYAILALGFVVVYKTSRVLNLAHPGFVMLGGYAALSTITLLGGRTISAASAILGILALLALATLLGVGTYTLVIRRMAGESRISVVLVTLAMLFFVEAVTVVFWSGEVAFVPFPGGDIVWDLAGARLRALDLAVVLVSGATLATVGLLYGRSNTGIKMRAVAENPALAARRGINVDGIGRLSWGLGLELAVVGGLMLSVQSPVSPLFVLVTLKGFTVALVGGLDSVGGIVPSALLIAASETVVVRFVDQQLGEAIPFLILVIVLWLRPWGLMGSVEEYDRV